MLIDTVRQTIREHDLIHRGDHIVLGLSGGPDSVCLFHILQRLAGEMDLTIHPVHVNHQFRPGAAEEDQAYVEALCAKAADPGIESSDPEDVAAGSGRKQPRRPGVSVLPCRSFVVDCKAMAKERGLTSEEAGRKARYDAFVQVARETRKAQAGQEAPSARTDRETPDARTDRETSDARIGREVPGPGILIAVAQNANDQAETILHRILRGTGTDGLSGIAYRRLEQGIPVIRPLLDVSRSEIEAYCEENGLDPVTDHTNREPIYTRNRIRLDLLPKLEEYNPGIIETLARLGRIAAADKEYMWQQAEAAYRQLRLEEDHKSGAGAGSIGHAPAEVVLDRAGLSSQPAAIRHRLIVRAFGEIGLASDISEERLRAADAIIEKKQAPKTVEFPRGYRLTVRQGRVCFRGPAR